MRPKFWSEERFEDALFMLSTGEHPERIATRLGTTLAGLAQAAMREGHAELAQAARNALWEQDGPENKDRRNAWQREYRARRRRERVSA